MYSEFLQQFINKKLFTLKKVRISIRLCKVLFHSSENMEKSQRLTIYKRIHREFNVTKFKKYYYCSQNSYFQLIDKFREKFGCSAKIMVRTDHIVVKGEEGILLLFLLCAHSSGKCASFLH